MQGGEDSGLKVTIGSENKFTGIQDCSMVQATYRLNGSDRRYDGSIRSNPYGIR